MKHIVSIFLICFSQLLFSTMANAEIIYFDFSGNINAISDNAGITQDQGVTINSPINLVIAINQSIDAFTISNAGDTTILTESIPSNQDYIYSELISGSLIQEKDGGFFNNPDNIAHYHSFFVFFTFGGASGVFTLGSDNNKIELFCIFPLDSQSAPCGGSQRAFNSNGKSSTIDFNGNLVTTTIPIPSSFILLSSSLFLLRKNYKNNVRSLAK